MAKSKKKLKKNSLSYQTMQRQQSLEESQPYNIPGCFTDCPKNNNLYILIG